MSMVDKGNDDAFAQDESTSFWTHEVCRVWCQPGSASTTATSDFTLEQPSSNIVCVLCGIGSTGSVLHHEGKQTTSTDDNMQSAPLGSTRTTANTMAGGRNVLPTGLVKCAAKGCCITFHPMCATLATKLLAARPIDSHARDRKSRKRSPSDVAGRHHDGVQNDFEERKASDIYLCKQYTLNLVETKHGEDSHFDAASTIVPVAFCGLHNPDRELELYGCLPGGDIIQND